MSLPWHEYSGGVPSGRSSPSTSWKDLLALSGDASVALSVVSWDGDIMVMFFGGVGCVKEGQQQGQEQRQKPGPEQGPQQGSGQQN